MKGKKRSPAGRRARKEDIIYETGAIFAEAALLGAVWAFWQLLLRA